jgi:hypothetical protein
VLTFKSLGKKGNLGNQLFHIASTIGIAKKNKHEFVFPNWYYTDFFNYSFPIIKEYEDYNFVQVVEKSYSFHEWDLGQGNYDVNGALQSEKYFDKVFTKKIFEFKAEFLKELLNKYKYLFDKNTIFISVRRGDFVYHPDYYQLPYQYYFLALEEYFPDWKERNLIFMSDNINYCKYHYSFLKNAIFLENLSAIEQLAIGSQGKDFIISNSTFSWWTAWLGEKEDSKIIRPLKNFRGSLAKLNDDSDFFPEQWIKFDYKKNRIGLKYFSLTIKGRIYQIADFLQFSIKKIFFLMKKTVNKIFK